MKALIAFDKFKGSLSATEACAVATEAVGDFLADAHIENAPLTDGGEGFVELLTAAAEGETRHCEVSGPLGQPVRAAYGLVRLEKLPPAVRDMLKLPREGTLAVVEMAQASGLQLLTEPERDPWKTTTRGTGELLQQAFALQPEAIILGVGGSATHDLGLGALHALGLQSATSSDPGADSVDAVPENWGHLNAFSGKADCHNIPLWIASDVDNPLLGQRGAATVFAPQKGLRPHDLERLETESERVARLLCRHFKRDPKLLSDPGSGAAGGIGAGLRIACDARMISGFSLVRAWLDLDRKIAEAELILTGEGTFDESSLEGKGPGVLVRKAEEAKIACLVLTGNLQVSSDSQRRFPSCRFIEISPPDIPVERAMAEGAKHLREAIRQVLSNSGNPKA